MYIGGVQWTSVIDFPGRVATTLFTVGCNFRCRYCQNRNLVLPDEYPNNEIFLLEKVGQRLKKRKTIIDSLVITGGEPLMHKDYLDFFQYFKEMGFTIKLDTNGAYPRRLKKLLDEKIVDYIAMDYKVPLARYPEITGTPLDSKAINQSIKMLCETQYSIPVEFRTTVAAPLVSLKDVQMISQDLHERGAKCYYLQQVQVPNHLLVDPKLSITPYSKMMLKKMEKDLLSPFFSKSGIRGI